MTDSEYVKDCCIGCKHAAQDVKEAGNYAAYAFSKNNIEDGKRWFGLVRERADRLASEIRSLDYALEREKASTQTAFSEKSDALLIHQLPKGL